MVHVTAAVATAVSILSGSQLISPTIRGNDPQTGQGPYDSATKRAAYAGLAALSGLAGAYALHVYTPTTTAPSTFKTVVTLGTLGFNTPSIIRNIYKGDPTRPGAQGPYATFTGRAVGHAQEAATAVALAYLISEYPETAYTLGEFAFKGTLNLAGTALNVAAKAATVAGNALYYTAYRISTAMNTIATAVNAGGDAASAVAGFFSSAYNAVFGGEEPEL